MVVAAAVRRAGERARPPVALVEASLGVLGRESGLTLARLLSSSSSARGSSLVVVLLAVVVVVVAGFLGRAGVPVAGALLRLSSWARRSSSVMDFFWAMVEVWIGTDIGRSSSRWDVVGGA